MAYLNDSDNCQSHHSRLNKPGRLSARQTHTRQLHARQRNTGQVPSRQGNTGQMPNRQNPRLLPTKHTNTRQLPLYTQSNTRKMPVWQTNMGQLPRLNKCKCSSSKSDSFSSGGCDDTMKAHTENRLLPMINGGGSEYDYDLIVIGGGSGGLAASKVCNVSKLLKSCLPFYM